MPPKRDKPHGIYCHVSAQEWHRRNLIPGDKFNVYISVISRSIDANGDQQIKRLTDYDPVEVHCKIFFFQEGRFFLGTLLSNPYVPSERLDTLVPEVMSKVQQRFKFDESRESCSDLEPCLFRLVVTIILYGAHPVDEIISPPPPSKEAIQEFLGSLKVLTFANQCSICNGRGQVCPTPCGHEFHLECLPLGHATHRCPLCGFNFPLCPPPPTPNDVTKDPDPDP